MRIVILDLKWSYGIEVLADQLSRHLGKYCEVSVISAKRPRVEGGARIARQDKHLDSAMTLVNPFVYVRLLRRIRAINPQVIYFISPHVLNVPLVLFCKWFTDAVVISHIHDPDHAGSPMIAGAANLVARLQSRWSHRVYCWGMAIKETIARNFGVRPNRIAVFRHGPGHPTPADDESAELSKRSPKYFSMIGTIIPRKGVEYYLEAARLFNERHGANAVQFLLAGSGDLTRYKSAIEQLPNLVVENRFLEDAEVNQFLANSYASVLPYTAGVMQSSFIAIAYGNGCPVIVSNIGSLPEEVEGGKTGYVVGKANATQIADAMTRIYTVPERAQMTRDCTGAYRAKFTWNVICAQMFSDMVDTARRCRGHISVGQEIRGE